MNQAHHVFGADSLADAGGPAVRCVTHPGRPVLRLACTTTATAAPDKGVKRMNDGHRKTMVGLAALAAVGLSACSSKKSDSAQESSTQPSSSASAFAPTDAAFNKLPASALNDLKTNSDKLKSILTYHVVPGQLSPAQVDGSHPTVQGAPVNVTGSGDGLKVNDAGLVCGGVPTANATVYMIDTVLMPPGQ
jgi:uncharacterized surface protein with fasciclin (FAS1) repeats